MLLPARLGIYRKSCSVPLHYMCWKPVVRLLLGDMERFRPTSPTRTQTCVVYMATAIGSTFPQLGFFLLALMIMSDRAYVQGRL